jgi:sarcosine/dimethylglycine N-methyltransferase
VKRTRTSSSMSLKSTTMKTNEYSRAVETAREYYNSDDADNFYFHVWGGEDIHVGLYRDDSEPIADASRRTVEQMAAKLDGLDRTTRVIDIGAGYGGSARYLAEQHGCHVTALNLSEVENARNRSTNAERGLDQRIDVVDGSFESIPAEDASFDVVWSQDAILHSGDRIKVLAEIARVLRPGGQVIFTDPMQSDDCPDGVLDPILERIHLDTLGSPGFYRAQLEHHGFEDIRFEDHSEQLVRHYSRVLAETEQREGDLDGLVSGAYIERMKQGLRHWIDGGNAGYLAWGIFTARR